MRTNTCVMYQRMDPFQMYHGALLQVETLPVSRVTTGAPWKTTRVIPPSEPGWTIKWPYKATLGGHQLRYEIIDNHNIEKTPQTRKPRMNRFENSAVYLAKEQIKSLHCGKVWETLNSMVDRWLSIFPSKLAEKSINLLETCWLSIQKWSFHHLRAASGGDDTLLGEPCSTQPLWWCTC